MSEHPEGSLKTRCSHLDYASSVFSNSARRLPERLGTRLGEAHLHQAIMSSMMSFEAARQGCEPEMVIELC
jgi:hypothetical protein